MSTKPQSPGPNSTPATASKQARSRKAANPEPSTAGRAGSAGGVVLEKEAAKKSSTPKAASTQPRDAKAHDAKQDAKPEAPKKKPRKLNKEPTSTSSTTPATKDTVTNEAAELEALKSRVRGLEAKVEELYKTTTSSASPRSPRRRGKGRKNSSATTTATLGNLSQRKDQQAQVQGDEEEADEELIRLEDELETARQDLALYNPPSSRPRTRRTASEDTEYVEEIPRERPGVSVGSDRQVTLSGSYRIPLPATLNPEDVKTIQSGVSAAQNVARSFLDQRRANQALRNAQADAGPPPSSSASAPSKAKKKKEHIEPELQPSTDAGSKQSWGEWIGGYSLAISRAVKNIEHEAAMEAQSQNARPRSGRTGSGTARKKRPSVKTTLSGEQVEGLMS
ncbi:hypothetical protein E8E12_009564 [Didymella heteroderae]|uniref:Uncharacterized protein n=1 Tax=Didymella heteroderae TaxID=1769908 RepID=A0A9P4WVB6_9PLEO|nr:hypothetical protein E8E12_009564 [Didymella heteroderae]